MGARSACGHGTSDGTSKTERGTSMDKIKDWIVRPRGKWTDRELNQVKFLKDYNSASQIAKIFGATKNAVIGALYRDKIRNGYVPSEDSKYTVSKIRHRFKRDSSLGKRECNICSKTFTMSSKFDRFCYECRRTGRVV